MSGTAAERAQATLLIVDDTPANLGVVVEYLEVHAFRVLVAQDGAEGLSRAQLVLPDLILLDVMMPRLDGFEVCRRLKADPRTSGIPVIFMTSLTDTHDKVAGFAAGAADYLTKPLHAEEMLARVNAHLHLRALARQLEARNAQLAAANESLQAFNYSVSHDLRAPLRAITGFAEVLAQEHAAGLSAQGRQCLERILVNSTRMTALIDSLLRYARTGGADVRAVPVALEPMVQQIAATFYERIRSSGTSFEAVSPLATPIGDPTLIGQILSNLVDNALKYSCRERPPRVRISAIRRDGRVLIRVADNGIGIEAEHHAKIFEIFERLHTAEEYQGSGIGLAIVAKSARLMRGEVAVESTPGGGSTFSVSLPAAEPLNAQ